MKWKNVFEKKGRDTNGRQKESNIQKTELSIILLVYSINTKHYYLTKSLLKYKKEDFKLYVERL